MGLPRSLEARGFYRAAWQRFEDARFLLSGERTTAAVYLAGYAVECMLKALIMSRVVRNQRASVLKSFRGAKAHDFEWLKAQYHRLSRASFPADLARELARVNTWTTDLRYRPGTLKASEAAAFLASAEAIMVWVDRSL